MHRNMTKGNSKSLTLVFSQFYVIVIFLLKISTFSKLFVYEHTYNLNMTLKSFQKYLLHVTKMRIHFTT